MSSTSSGILHALHRDYALDGGKIARLTRSCLRVRCRHDADATWDGVSSAMQAAAWVTVPMPYAELHSQVELLSIA